MKQIQVLLPRPFNEPFDYLVPEGMNADIGNFVSVPFGSKNLNGVVWGTKQREISRKIKYINSVYDLPSVSPSLRKFIDWVAEYNLAPAGSVLAMSMSVPQVFKYIEKYTVEFREESISIKENNVKLSEEQKRACEAIRKKIGSYNAILLDGVTGSGKTEVYFEVIREVLHQGKQVLVLLPEIILTAQFMQRFEERFGFRPTQWHSSLTPKWRRENWLSVIRGKAKLIVGARSALFIPYKNLGLIIVDEEHEGSYKQEDGVIYHGRDMAIAKAHVENIPVILVSASPSIETVVNSITGKFSRIHLESRHGKATMPEIRAVDMRLERLDAQHWISSELKQELAENLAKNEQSLLFLNRRGYAPLKLCRKCGYRFQCPECSAWLVEHRVKEAYLQCHHCGYSLKPVPMKCPSCEEIDSFASCGPGVERLRDEVVEFLPDARIAVMTSDDISTPKEAEKIVRDIENGEVDIIIGTQMVAKGHHFPKLTLVGVIDADMGLEGGDIRAAEKSFQLLNQVSGRAGRENLKGRVMVQSYMPENSVIQNLLKNSRDEFIAAEIRRREKAHMPPFSRMAAIIISGRNEADVKKFSLELVKLAPYGKNVKILGPAPAPMLMLRGNYRYRILAITDRNINIQRMLQDWTRSVTIPGNLKLKLDIDPYNFI